ncbi:MAG: PepSY-associated TM helix domain-containing protein [Tahibacter sp.]
MTPISAQQRRAAWLKSLHQWHWISAAACLIGLLLFSATGITLNHSAQIAAKPVVTNRQGVLPLSIKIQLAAARQTGKAVAPDYLAVWFSENLQVSLAGREIEWNDGEVYVSLPRPGGDAWASIALDSGEVEYERTDRGWLSWFNDLHKGRNTGAVWTWFIDIFAISCLLFALSGLLLLQMHASRRPLTWPVVGFGLLLPLAVAILFIH